MRKKISLNFKGKSLKLNVTICNSFRKFSGLMFKSRDTEILLFEFAKSTRIRIHSFFVFFPFFAIWIDGKDKVIQVKRVKPFTFSVRPKESFRKILEIPINEKNREILKLLVGD
jgi:uncharacterized membrane protein (UPF0127 family)